MKKYFTNILVCFISFGLIVPLCAATTASALIHGGASAENSIAYTGVTGPTVVDLTDMHTTAYNKTKIGTITINNNAVKGFTIKVDSATAQSSATDSRPLAAKLLLDEFNYDYNAGAGANNDKKHREVDGAFIYYNVTVWPAGQIDVVNSTGSQTNDYTTNNFHGCFIDAADSVDTDTSALYTLEQGLFPDHTMSFNLSTEPCVSKTNGVTGTVDFDYDLLISTNQKKQLLTGSFKDTLTLTIADIP